MLFFFLYPDQKNLVFVESSLLVEEGEGGPSLVVRGEEEVDVKRGFTLRTDHLNKSHVKTIVSVKIFLVLDSHLSF